MTPNDPGAGENEGDLLPAWERAVSRWQKLRRSALIGVSVIVALALLLSASGAGANLWGRAQRALIGPEQFTLSNHSVAGHPPAQSSSPGWSEIALPDGSAAQRRVVASPTDPAMLFVCSTALPPTDPSGSWIAARLTLWRSRDTGATWRQVALPSFLATDCSITIARDDPRRIVAFALGPTPGSGCAQTVAYLSDDGGERWRALSLPRQPAPADECWMDVSARHLYYVTFMETYVGETHIERSDDGGATWVRADNGFSAGAHYMPALFSANGETLGASVTASRAQPQAEFWLSRNAGRRWERMGTISPNAGSFLLVSQQPGSDASRIPAFSYVLQSEQIPSSLYRVGALQSADGVHWTALPALPIKGLNVERAQTGLTDALGVIAGDTLLFFGADPQEGVPQGPISASDIQTHWLWRWNPQSRQWASLTNPLTAQPTGFCSALCWQSSFTWATRSDGATIGAYVWVADFQASQLFRTYIPA